MSQTGYTFHGDPARRPANAHPDSPQQPEPYVAASTLMEAVNLAIFLRRPLLLEGEAGCGKTRLARTVAYELGLPFYAWYVRSSSKAQEGLYAYDAILRLHDVQTVGLPGASGASGRDPRRPTDYRRFGALGKAFTVTDRPAVVLIDEIDKADIDFPNDLLAVLDDPWSFEILETDEVVKADPEYKPIVLITSNKEKGNLPAPFLRRCIYYFIEFPANVERLQEIVAVHYRMSHEAAPSPQLVAAASQRFLALRQDEGLHKKPGTSEFLDWLKALQLFKSEPYAPERVMIDKPVAYRELLFKLRLDWQQAAEAK